VTDGQEFFSEEKTDARHETTYLAEGVPAYRLINTCKSGRYRIEKTIFAHPRHHAVIQLTKFAAIEKSLRDFHLYALLAPHLGGQGAENTAWVAEYKGQPLLFAQRDSCALALACSNRWARCSVGFVGVSDGWQELHRHKHLMQVFDHAERGNVALTGEIDLEACHGTFAIALAFGGEAAEAAFRARSVLLDDLDSVQKEYVQAWQDYQKTFRTLKSARSDDRGLFRTSTLVLGVHEGKSIMGTVASLSVPWGMERGDNQRLEGGYHLVWPRDLVETAGGFLAAGSRDEALRRLSYLRATQEEDGHWPQNMWLTGEPFWKGIQLCETGLPILLFNLLRREGLDPSSQSGFWPMARAASNFLIHHGPSTQEDRWEQETGYTPFTLAVVIAALLAAADMADSRGESDQAQSFRRTADEWNACIEGWLYVTDSDLARRMGVDGYYARILSPDVLEPAKPGQHCVRLRNSPPKKSGIPAHEVVSPDALALVRYGLRAPDDPRIINTVKVIDALLKVEFPNGPCWRRFNGDQYGEKPDGSPFFERGQGSIGRAWPLLTGERAHYELAAGRRDEAERLLHVMEQFASDTGLLPEQIWDADDIPERGLFRGRPSGSAMPLVWAHAEYLKLRRSLQDGRVFDMPTQTVSRYLNSLSTGKSRPMEESHEKSDGASRRKRAGTV
jgi:glucoamylase